MTWRDGRSCKACFSVFAPLTAVAMLACTRPSGPAAGAGADDGIAGTLVAFLEQRGDLCLGKLEWPIEVLSEDSGAATSDAAQLPVLERHGVTTSSKTSNGRSYRLTELGLRSYLARGADKHGDLCPGQVELERVVAIQRQAGASSAEQVLVRYTYRLALAGWARDPEVLAVFPMLARLLAGEHLLPMELRFRRAGSGWIAVNPFAEPHAEHAHGADPSGRSLLDAPRSAAGS